MNDKDLTSMAELLQGMMGRVLDREAVLEYVNRIAFECSRLDIVIGDKPIYQLVAEIDARNREGKK